MLDESAVAPRFVPSLSDLPALLDDARGRRILGTTLDELGGQLERRHRDTLDELRRLVGVRQHAQLQRLLGDPKLRFVVHDIVGTERGEHLAKALWQLVDASDAENELAPPHPDAPPADDHAVFAWATRVGVEDALDAPALVLLPTLRWSSAFARDTFDPKRPLRRCLRAVDRPDDTFPGHFDRLRHAAREYLARLAEQRAIDTWRERVRQRPLDEPELRPLVEALQDLLAQLPEPITDAAGLRTLDEGRVSVVFVERPPQIKLRRTYDDIAVLELSDWEHGGVRFSSDSKASPNARRLLVDLALDALHGPAHTLRGPLRDVLAPVWPRLLDQLRPPSTRRASPSRIVWRVAVENGLHLDVLVQKRLKNGRWSKGRAHAAWKELPADADATELDRLIAADVRTPPRGSDTADEQRRRWGRILDWLARHPTVVDADNDPIDVAPTALSLRVHPAERGHRLQLRFAGRIGPIGRLLDEHKVHGNLVHLDTEDRVLRYRHLDADEHRVLRAFADYDLTVTDEQLDPLLSTVLRAAPNLTLELPPSLCEVQRPADARLVLRIAPQTDGGARAVVGVRPAPQGALQRPGEAPAAVLGMHEGSRALFRRNLDAERAAAESLVERTALGPAAMQRAVDLPDEEAILALLDEVRDDDTVVVEWPQDVTPMTVAGTTSSLSVRVGSVEGWLSVEGHVEVDGSHVELAALLRAIRAGRRFVPLGKGRFARIEEELRRRLEADAESLHERGRDLAAGLAEAERLLELLDDITTADAVRGMGELRTAVDRIRKARALAPVVPVGLAATLRPYQREGYDWLMRLSTAGLGACLADDMGLGKTLQALALLVARSGLGPALVVAPTSVNPNWESEAARFTPGLRVLGYRGKGRADLLEGLRAGDVVVTSYDIVHRDIDALSKLELSTLVLDEAQAIKNPRSKRARAIYRLDAGARVALTGTPLENHLGELWSILHAVSPGLLGPYADFRTRYQIPIEKDGSVAHLERLSRRVRPFLLRRTKSQVAADLPPRIEIARPVLLSKPERALYDAARKDAIVQLARLRAGDKDVRLALLADLLRLRQLACHPRLVDPSSTIASSKLAAFEELVAELLDGGHRALVFSQFTKHLGLVRERLDKAGVSYLYLDGSTPVDQRKERVERFQTGHAPLFLISLKAGGTGLNLTAADTVVHLDPWWNPAVEDQASDRAHRIGQDKPVTIVRLVSADTIEEKVYALHSDKRELAEGILHGADRASRLDPDGIAELLDG